MTAWQFPVNEKTRSESFQRQLIGSSDPQDITAGDEIFLYDYSNGLIYGPFQATEATTTRIDPAAFDGAFPQQTPISWRSWDVYRVSVDEYEPDETKDKLTPTEAKVIRESLRTRGTPIRINPVTGEISEGRPSLWLQLQDQVRLFRRRPTVLVDLLPIDRIGTTTYKLLLGALVFGAVLEIGICATAGAEWTPWILPDQCIHFVNLTIVNAATTLSFSLTAFLLVGGTVIGAIAGIQTIDSRDSESESDGEPRQGFDLHIIEQGTSDESDSDQPVIRITDFAEGNIVGESGRWQWNSQGGYIGPNLVITEPFIGGIRVVQTTDHPEAFQFNPGQYRIYPWETVTEAATKPPGTVIGRAYGTINGSLNQISHLRTRIDDDKKIDWLVTRRDRPPRPADRTTDVERILIRVKRALEYAISASLIGIILQGFPIASSAMIANTLGIPIDQAIWVTWFEHVAYFVGSYVFAVIFLGMIKTSLGFFELLSDIVRVGSGG